MFEKRNRVKSEDQLMVDIKMRVREVYRGGKARQLPNTIDNFVRVSPQTLSMQSSNMLQTNRRKYESTRSPLLPDAEGWTGP